MDTPLTGSLSLELALVLLLAAMVAVPLFRKLGLVAVLAYLATGVLLGPDGIGVVRDPDRILAAAEIGVVMLLFVIGLELSPKRLALMRRPVFGAGGTQVVLSALLLGAALVAYGLQWKGALVAGLGLALSSTAVGLQLLSERHQLNSDFGRLAFAILLFQDLIAIPLLATIPLLGGVKNATLTWTMVGHALGALALVWFGGRLLMHRALRIVAGTQAPEVFTATALLAVLGSAWIVQQAGLSPGLGAFIAGVLLADSEYRHELESQIQPFKGLLLGLFFIAVGMGIDLDRIAAEPWLVAGGVALLLAVKFAVLFGVGRAAGLATSHALMLGGTLWLGGEFAFVVFQEALRVRLVSAENHDRLVAIVGVSMALMPLLLLALDRRMRRHEARQPQAEPARYDVPDAAAQPPQVVIAGVGRFGQIIRPAAGGAADPVRGPREQRRTGRGRAPRRWPHLLRRPDPARPAARRRRRTRAPVRGLHRRPRQQPARGAAGPAAVPAGEDPGAGAQPPARLAADGPRCRAVPRAVRQQPGHGPAGAAGAGRAGRGGRRPRAALSRA